ncbi:hypothetical protein [Siccirubricoccus deserti]|nr:hypothetical protein [Siccirubricoccus deserti]
MLAMMTLIPLIRAQNVWAARHGLRYEPRMNERMVAMGPSLE